MFSFCYTHFIVGATRNPSIFVGDTDLITNNVNTLELTAEERITRAALASGYIYYELEDDGGGSFTATLKTSLNLPAQATKIAVRLLATFTNGTSVTVKQKQYGNINYPGRF